MPSSLPFKKYSSIENSYREAHVDKCMTAIALGHCVDDFVVEEKAHGANFSFYFDGSELKTACRSVFLSNDGEAFSKSHLVKQKYAGAIKELYSLLGFTTGSSIRVVGELIGGSYNHPEVPAQRNLPRIQKGVDYCPGHEFYAFDLSVLSDDKGKWYTTMDKLEMNKLFEQVGLLFARPLFRGTLKDCLAFGNTFKNHIPEWLGLPEHPDENLAEGKVIKPVHYACLGNGERIILKDKTESFAEIVFGKARDKPQRSNGKMDDISDKGADLLRKLLAYATENRLQNVLSKMPETPTTAKDCGRLCGLLSQDALEDFKKDFGQAFEALDPKERKSIQKTFATRVKELVLAALPSGVDVRSRCLYIFTRFSFHPMGSKCVHVASHPPIYCNNSGSGQLLTRIEECTSLLTIYNYVYKNSSLAGFTTGSSIRVVGELIGGSYNHPEVPAQRNLPRIQKGVDYCPGHEFYAFDLSVLSDDKGKWYTTMDKLEMNKLFEQVGLLFAKPLFRGTLKDCLAFGNTFKSHIPEWLGLPEHPDENIAEGKVIKPVHYACLGNGKRIMLKDKTESFAEIVFGKTRNKPQKGDGKMDDISDKGVDLLRELRAYATESRLQNVLSKMPETPTISMDCGRVCGLLSQDALEDFKKDFGQDFEALDPKERKSIQKTFATSVKELVLAS
eukprot:CAMPEP_0113501130 /NCGR_PEP_ID=MMETSP0014_2-20120614/32775_1 /TAXON_ID=2857 /ORGANISM="Nitzschia sp." /LENGTH=673 /DNA_ID=CAMNT_0000395667 /DNA_START=47 /DNA_END=2067 /DNA_ORIENTATION=- /assembly_acc=CAM_ASM_000159